MRRLAAAAALTLCVLVGGQNAHLPASAQIGDQAPAWAPYVPDLAGTGRRPSCPGAVTARGRYQLDGPTVHVLVELRCVGGFRDGVGIWRVSLPVEPAGPPGSWPMLGAVTLGVGLVHSTGAAHRADIDGRQLDRFAVTVPALFLQGDGPVDNLHAALTYEATP